MKGKNIWSVYSQLSPQQWRITTVNQNLKLINNYSEEEFTMIRISPYSQSFLQSLKIRSFYPIPNTPKIIMPKYQIDSQKIEALVQSQHKQIAELIKKTPCDILILEKLKSVIRTVQMLTKKYGFFRISPKMLKVTKRESILVWIHERTQLQIRMLPIVKQKQLNCINIMINDLFTIFMKQCKGGFISSTLEKLNRQKITSFEVCISEIEKYMKEQIKKSKIPSKHSMPEFLKNKSPNKKLRSNNQKQDKNFHASKSIFKKDKKIAYCLPKIKSHEHLFAQNRNHSRHLDTSSQATSKQFSNKNVNLMRQVQDTNCAYKNSPESFNSMFLINKQLKDQKKQSPYKSMGQISIYRKQISQADKQSTKCDKKNIRDSSNSLATTNFYHSITSSGRTKLLEEQGASFQKKVTNSFGEAKNTRSRIRPENRFKVKASKIIQEYNCEDGTQNSPQSNENSDIINKSQCLLYQSQIEKDFYDLLYQDTSKDQQGDQMKISDHLKLQQEFGKVLF